MNKIKQYLAMSALLLCFALPAYANTHHANALQETGIKYESLQTYIQTLPPQIQTAIQTIQARGEKILDLEYDTEIFGNYYEVQTCVGSAEKEYTISESGKTNFKESEGFEDDCAMLAEYLRRKM